MAFRILYPVRYVSPSEWPGTAADGMDAPSSVQFLSHCLSRSPLAVDLIYSLLVNSKLDLAVAETGCHVFRNDVCPFTEAASTLSKRLCYIL